MSETQPMSAPLAKRLRCVPQNIEDACQTMEDAATRIEELEPKAAAYEACRSKIDCLSRGAVPVRDDGALKRYQDGFHEWRRLAETGAERIRELEETLAPFAEIAGHLTDVLEDDEKNNMLWAVPTVGQLRAALSALQPKDTAK